jgi:D-serine deaminase-like pyridoxal phosphate-dependent protein
MHPPADLKPDLYDPTTEIETPAVLVDLDAMERNMADYAAFADEQGIALRSHAKTHKIPDIAHRQQELTGGDGILCQTLSEAEVMAQNGIDDIYLSYMVVEESKLDRLVWLSERLDQFATTVDGPGNVHPLQAAAERHDATVDVVLEFDIGLGRVGAPTPEAAVEVAALIERQPNLRFAGVMAYEAHVSLEADSEAEFERLCHEAMEETAAWIDRIEDEVDVTVDDVKVGGTSTSKFSGRHPIVTEINPGMYPFNDVGELRRRDYELTRADCAVTVVATVISSPTDDRAVVDAGSKAISMDIDGLAPVPKHRDDVEYLRSSEEHGWLETEPNAVEVGDRIEFVVPHVCTTINLHDTLVGVRDGRVEEVWEVAARGKEK